MATSSSASFSAYRPPEPRGVAAAGHEEATALLRAKLGFVLARVAQLFNAVHPNIALLQVWFRDAHGRAAAPKDALQAEYHADPDLAVVADAGFHGFRTASAQCHDCGRLSMPGRIFRSGCVQVVQSLKVLPSCLHPRSRLADALADRVAEAVYLPVYDLARPEAGPVAVVEALLARGAVDSMLVANLMSFTGSQLSGLQLSLSSPLPQPVLPSSLAGRRPRPPADLCDSEDEGHRSEEEAWPAAPRRIGVKQTRRDADGGSHACCAAAAAAMPPPSCVAAAAVTKAACEPSGALLPVSLACSADSTAWDPAAAAGADAASCGAFPRPAACASGAAPCGGAAARAVRAEAPAVLNTKAATAPPDLCREDEDGGIMGPPRSKRPRCLAGSALAMRRTVSLPRSLSDLLREGAGEAPAADEIATAAPLAPRGEFMGC